MSPSAIGPSAMSATPTATALNTARRRVDDMPPVTGLPAPPPLRLHQHDHPPSPVLVPLHVEVVVVLHREAVGGNEHEVWNHLRQHPDERLDDRPNRARRREISR